MTYIDIYVYVGISFTLKKNPAICDDMDEPGGQHAKWNKPDRERKNCMVSLTCGILKKKKQQVELIETEYNGGYPGVKGWGKRGEIDKRMQTFSYKLNKVWTSTE